MKKFFTIILISVGIHVLGATQCDNRPNVIVVLSDDQGYGDFSCHGNPVLKTPALDKLYNEGIHFSNFHVSPLCTPTRGELMTGLDAMHNKAATVLTGRNLLRRDIVTMPEVFAQNGYATGIFGKWHLGDNYPDRPMDRGFQKCIWHKSWGLLSEIEFDNDYYETRYLDSLETKQSGEYCTNLWFNKAIEWMGEMANNQKPFFTYLALNAPHGPFYSPAQDYNFYKDQVADSTVASFLGMIRNIDRNMAKLDQWLEKSGLKENTIIIFMTDNGGTGGVKLYNAGMRDKKGSNYDGGHRAACFMRWPDGEISGGREVLSAVQIQDLLPTFIDLLHLKVAGNTHFDGESLTPVIQNKGDLADRMFVVQYGGHVQPEKYFSCVVWNNWRLVGKNELYNIELDPGQKENVASANPAIAGKMRDFYENWWKTVEPGVNQIIPVVVGSDKENPVIFNSNNWVDGAVNTQWKVALAAGTPQGGTSHIYIEQSGKYKIEISRWPFHLNRSLTAGGPKSAVGGTGIRGGKALPIHYGCISFNDENPVISECAPQDTKLTFEMNLEKGKSIVKAWFQNSDNNDICGAYYVRMEKLF